MNSALLNTLNGLTQPGAPDCLASAMIRPAESTRIVADPFDELMVGPEYDRREKV